MYCITKWTKAITDSGKDEYTGRLAKMKENFANIYGKPITNDNLHDFRLLDDDGEVYAYGKSTTESFAPLDKYCDWYGCTEIQYKNKQTGKYETL